MDNSALFHRWASLGVSVPSENKNRFEDPEQLIAITLKTIVLGYADSRLLGILTSWISQYGHLVITRKLSDLTASEQRLLAAVIDESGSTSQKLKLLLFEPMTAPPKPLVQWGLESMDKIPEREALPNFLKYGFLVKKPKREGTLIRKKIILNSREIFKRSLILKNRAIFGPSIRTDVGTLLPHLKQISGHALAKKLYVTPQTLQPILIDFSASGLIEWQRKGRASIIKWLDKTPKSAA